MPYTPSQRSSAASRAKQERAQQQGVQSASEVAEQQAGPARESIRGFFSPAFKAPTRLPDDLPADEVRGYSQMFYAEGVERDLRNHAELDEELIEGFSLAVKAEIAEQVLAQHFPGEVLDERIIRNILMNSGDKTPEEFTKLMMEVNAEAVRSQLAAGWNDLSPGEKAARWSRFDAAERMALKNAGILPTAPGLKAGAVAQGLHTLSGDGLIAKGLRGFEAAEQTARSIQRGMNEESTLFQDIEGSAQSMSLWTMAGGGTEEQREESERQGRAKNALADEAVAQMLGAISLVNVTNIPRYWRAGRAENNQKTFYTYEDAQGVFDSNVQEQTKEDFDLENGGMDMALGMAKYVESRDAEMVMDDPENEQLLYQGALENWLQSSIAGANFTDTNTRAMLYSGLLEDEQIKGAVLQLAREGRNSVGRNVAARAGVVPGDPEYNDISGQADAANALLADPTIIVGKVTSATDLLRFGLRAADNSQNATRLVRILDRAPVRKVTDDVARAVREQLSVEVDNLIRSVGKAADSPDLKTEAIENYRNMDDPRVGRVFGFERVMKNNPNLTDAYSVMIKDFRQEVIHKIDNAVKEGSSEVTEVYWNRRVTEVDANGAVVMGTEIEPSVLARVNDDGLWEIAEEAIDHEAIKRWMLTAQNLDHLRTGRAGGVLRDMPIIPHKSLHQLPLMYGKQGAALALDFLNDSPMVVARKMMDSGIIDEKTFRDLGVGVLDSARRLGTNKALTKAVLDQNEGVDKLVGLGMTALRAGLASHLNPLMGTGRLLWSISNMSHNGAISLVRPEGNVMFRDYLSILPADQRSKFMALYIREDTPGGRMAAARHILSETMELGGTSSTKWGKQFKEEVLKKFEEASAFSNISKHDEAADVVIDELTGRAYHMALDVHDNAYKMSLPDIRRFQSVMARGRMLDAIGSPMEAFFQSGVMDWYHGRFWNPLTLLKPAFAIRASTDEIGLAMMREGIMPLLYARSAVNVARGHRVLPQILRADQYLLRRAGRFVNDLKFSHEETFQALVREGKLSQSRFETMESLFARLDEIEELTRGGFLKSNRAYRDAMDELKGEFGRGQRYTESELMQFAEALAGIKEYWRQANPFEIIATTKAGSTSSYVQRIEKMHKAGETASAFYKKWGITLSMTPQQLVDDAIRQLDYDPDASRDTPRIKDVTTVSQRLKYGNASAETGGVFNVGARVEDPFDPEFDLFLDHMEESIRAGSGALTQWDEHHLRDLAADMERRINGPMHQAVAEVTLKLYELYRKGEITIEQVILRRTEMVQELFETRDEIKNHLADFQRNHGNRKKVLSDAEYEMATRLVGTRQGDELNHKFANGRGDDPGPTAPGGGGGGDQPRGPLPTGGPEDAAYTESPVPDHALPTFESGRGDLLRERPKFVGDPNDFVVNQKIKEEWDQVNLDLEELDQIAGTRNLTAEETKRRDVLRTMESLYNQHIERGNRGEQALNSLGRYAMGREDWEKHGADLVDPRKRDVVFRMELGDTYYLLRNTFGQDIADRLFKRLGVFDAKTGMIDPIGFAHFRRHKFKNVVEERGAVPTQRIVDEFADEIGELELTTALREQTESNKNLLKMFGLPEQSDIPVRHMTPKHFKSLFYQVVGGMRTIKADEPIGRLQKYADAIMHKYMPFNTQTNRAFGDYDRIAKVNTWFHELRDLNDIDDLTPIVSPMMDDLEEFQSLFTAGDVDFFRKAWANLSLMDLDSDEMTVLDTLMRVNEAMGYEGIDFVASPVHLSAMRAIYARNLDAVSPSQFREAVIRDTNKARTRETMMVNNAAFGLVPANKFGSTDEVREYLNMLSKNVESALGRIVATKMWDDADLSDLLNLEIDSKAELVMRQELVSSLPEGHTEAFEEFIHDLRAGDEDIEQMLASVADEMGLVVDEDVPWPKATSTPPEALAKAVSPNEDTQAEVQRFLRAYLGVDVDLTQVDADELRYLSLEMADGGIIDEYELNMMLTEIDSYSFDKLSREMIESGMPETMHPVGRMLIDRFLQAESTGSVEDLAVSPLAAYLTHKYTTRMALDHNIDEMSVLIKNLRGNFAGQNLTKAEVDALGKEVDEALGVSQLPPQEPPSGPPPNAYPGPDREDPFESGRQMDFLGNTAFMPRREAVREHAEKVIESFDEAFIADAYATADEFHGGAIPPQEGRKYVHIEVGDDGSILEARDLPLSEIRDLNPGAVIAEVHSEFGMEAIIGSTLDDLKDIDGRHFKKPVRTEEIAGLEEVFPKVLEEMRKTAPPEVLDVINDPLDWDMFLAASAKMRGEDPEKWEVVASSVWTVITNSFMDQLRARADNALAQSPDALTENMVVAAGILLESNGLDPNRMWEPVSTKILSDSVSKYQAGQRALVETDVLREVGALRPRMLPREARSAKIIRKRGSEMDGVPNVVTNVTARILTPIVKKGFGDVMLPWIDTLSRHPMQFHYYSKGANESRAAVKAEWEAVAARETSPSRVSQAETTEEMKKRGLSEPEFADTAQSEWRYEQMRFSERFDEAGFPSTKQYKKQANEYRREIADEKAAGEEIIWGPDDYNWLRLDLPFLKSRTYGKRSHRAMQAKNIMGEDLGLYRMIEENPAIAKMVNDNIEELQRMVDGDSIRTISDAVETMVRGAMFHEEDIHRRSMNYAMSQMTAYTDMDSTGSLFAMKFRNLFPFWWAEERFLKRMAQSVYHSPETVQKMQLTYRGIDSYGYIEEDDEGNKIFVYPFSSMLGSPLARTMGFFFGNADEWIVPDIDRVTGRFRWAAPGVDTRGNPNIGPVGALALQAITSRFPEFEPVKDALLPEIAENPTKTPRDYLMPSPLRRVLDLPDAEERYAGQMFNAMAHMTAAGLAPWSDDPDAPPPTTDELQLFNNRVENYTRILATLSVIYGTVGLAPAEIDLVDTAKQQEFRQLIGLLGFDGAVTEFIRRNPDITPVTMFGTETMSGGPIAATKATLDQLQENREWFESDLGRKTATHFIMPGEDSEYSGRAMAQMFDMGIRYRKSDYPSGPDGVIRDVSDELYFQTIAPEYFEKKRRYELALDRVKGTSISADLTNEWKSEKERIFAQNPTFERILKSKVSDAESKLVDLREAITLSRQGKAPSNEKTEAIGVLLDAYGKLQEQLGSLGGYEGRTAPTAVINDAKATFIREGYDFVNSDPDNLSYIWHQLVLPAMGMSRQEALDKADIKTISQYVAPLTGDF